MANGGTYLPNSAPLHLPPAHWAGFPKVIDTRCAFSMGQHCGTMNNTARFHTSVLSAYVDWPMFLRKCDFPTLRRADAPRNGALSSKCTMAVSYSFLLASISFYSCACCFRVHPSTEQILFLIIELAKWPRYASPMTFFSADVISRNSGITPSAKSISR